MNNVIRPKRLVYNDVASAGKQIYADFDNEFNMVELRKLKGLQMIATEPWIQFEPKEWTTSIDRIFTEMVDLWNEKYGDESTVHPLDENLVELLEIVTEVTECLVLDSMKIPSFTKRRIEQLSKIHSEILDSDLIFKK